MATSLTVRLGAGPRTKHTDKRYFWVPERVQGGNRSIKKLLAATNCADVGTKPVSAQVLQQHCKIAGWYSTDHGSHTVLQVDGTFVESSRRGMCKTESNRVLSELVVHIETGAKLSETLGTVEQLSTWHDEWTMTGAERKKKRRRSKKCATSISVNTDWSHLSDYL